MDSLPFQVHPGVPEDKSEGLAMKEHGTNGMGLEWSRKNEDIWRAKKRERLRGLTRCEEGTQITTRHSIPISTTTLHCRLGWHSGRHVSDPWKQKLVRTACRVF